MDAKGYIESPNLVLSLIKTLKPLKIIGYSVIILCGGALCYLSIIGEWLQDSGTDLTYGNLSAVVLTAAHLKLGSEGTIRLNILAHNLRMMLPVENVTAMAEVKSILIVSHDGARREAQDFVDKWLAQDGVKNLVTHVIWERNDPVKVDLAKWLVYLRKMRNMMLQRMIRRVILINDSFVLIRKVPELFESRGDVLGLVWTGPPSDPNTHIQSYLRSLSSTGALAFLNYCEKEIKSAVSVSQVIRKFEMYLGWSPSGVQSLYEAAECGHPDSDDAQRDLLPKGYPAIKLKKYHAPDDPWLQLDPESRPDISPSFSENVYRKSNHDLNHMSDKQLRNHFASHGWQEGRVYSNLPLKIKPWLGEFLASRGAHSALEIFKDHLQVLNAANVTK